MASKKTSRKTSNAIPTTHRSTLSLQKTEVVINVYDLLPVSHTPISDVERLADPFQC
jgi:hypothetical protein